MLRGNVIYLILNRTPKLNFEVEIFMDKEDLRDDQDIDCFCIWFEDMLKANHICAGDGYYQSLCEAIRAAENSGGFVKWLD